MTDSSREHLRTLIAEGIPFLKKVPRRDRRDHARARAAQPAARSRHDNYIGTTHAGTIFTLRHFADAIAMNERLRARPFVVRTRRAWAAMLLDRGAPGDREHARELIAAGRTEAEQLGMAREMLRFERLQERL